MTMRNGLLAGGVALLAVVAAVGWTRKSANDNQPVQTTFPVQTAQTSAAYDANGQPVYGTAARQTYYAPGDRYDDRYYGSNRRPVRIVHQYAERSAPAPAPVEERRYYTDRRGHRRSTGKSVAIVAGSAAGGAAIGALAGGGKGAGIGALAGGGAGFIYDRLTHNHVH